MRVFNSLTAFADHLATTVISENIALRRGLEKAAILIEKSAKDEMGWLQPQVGPFVEWASLTEQTMYEKERLGYVFNDDYNPLIRTGELKDSISHEIH